MSGWDDAPRGAEQRRFFSGHPQQQLQAMLQKQQLMQDRNAAPKWKNKVEAQMKQKARKHAEEKGVQDRNAAAAAAAAAPRATGLTLATRPAA